MVLKNSSPEYVFIIELNFICMANQLINLSNISQKLFGDNLIISCNIVEIFLLYMLYSLFKFTATILSFTVFVFIHKTIPVAKRTLSPPP